MKKWVKVEDVTRLRDGQRVRWWSDGSCFEDSRYHGGAEDDPRVFRAKDQAFIRQNREPPEATGDFEYWLHRRGYTVEALEEEVDERARIAELWNQLELSLCAAIQETPTQWLSSRRWAVVELMMREIEATIAELRTEAGDGAAPTVGTAERNASRSAQNGEGARP